MILTETQLVALDRADHAIITTGLDLMVAHVDPDEIVRWLTARVNADPLLQIAPRLQECPVCHAVHDETEWPQIGMDDGWCSQGCQDTAAQAWFETHQARGWSEFAWPERGAA